MEQQVFDQNSLEGLKKIVQKTDPSKIFLVCGNKSYSDTKANDFISQLVDDSQLTVFNGFNPNPDVRDLEKGLELIRSGMYELIIAIGGGSVMDMAKLINVFTHQSNKAEELIKGNKKLKPGHIPLLAIPTTAGSGAEATKFAVVYIDTVKYSVESKEMMPNMVYLNSKFTEKAGAYLKACCGVDSFCQAIESVWNINANDESMGYALKAIELIWENLLKFVRDGDSLAGRKMQEAAYLAGKAINITKTTAPHAISYAFTSFHGIPHGHAVALSLSFFLKYNYEVTSHDCNDVRGPDFVRQRIEKVLKKLDLSMDNSGIVINSFFNKLGVDVDFKKNIRNFNPDVISQNVNIQRLNNNPRKVYPHTVSSFLDSANE